MIRKRIHDVLGNPQDDEFYVLVTRYYPIALRQRGMRLVDSPFELWDRDLAPSSALLDDYKDGRIDWAEYTERFQREIPRGLLREKYYKYTMYAAGKTVVLVCFESDSAYPRCHTWLLLDMFKEVEK